MKETAQNRASPAPMIVSVHDVAPSTYTSVAWLLDALDHLDVRPRSLLVIPGEPARPIARSPRLLSMLRREQAAGSELIVHGFTHRSSGPLQGPAWTRLRARSFAGGDAEFLSLGRDEAMGRLLAARRLLEQLGLQADGFCAPCWLSLPELPGLLENAGFRFQIGMSSLVDLAQHREHRVRWMGYMGAGLWQERLVSAIGNVLLRSPLDRTPVQIFLHPGGASQSRFCAAVLRSLQRLRRSRRVVRYADIIGPSAD